MEYAHSFIALSIVLDTVECRYNAVQYNKILHTSLQWRDQNINKRLNLQKTHHTSPYRASYGVSFVIILDKIDRVITTPHCISHFLVESELIHLYPWTHLPLVPHYEWRVSELG